MLTYELHELSNPTIHSSCIYQMFAICQAYARHWVISRKYFTKTVEVIRFVWGGGVQSIKESSLKLSQDNCGICFCHFSILPCTTLKVLTSHINDSKCQNSEILGSITILQHCPGRHFTVKITRPTLLPLQGMRKEAEKWKGWQPLD